MREILEDRLRVVAEDTILLQALKMVFEDRINKELPDTKDLDDTVIGQKYRAYDQAKNFLKEVFSDIESYKNKKVGSEKLRKEK